MNLHDKLFGDVPKTNDLTDEEKAKAKRSQELQDDIRRENVNEFTDLRALTSDIYTEDGKTDPIALLTGKEGSRIRQVPFAVDYRGIRYDVHGSYLNYDKDPEGVETALRLMILAFTTALNDLTPYERGNPIDLDDNTKRQSHQREYNEREWFITGCMALTYGCGIMINFHDRTNKDHHGDIEYAVVPIDSNDKAPFSFIAQQFLGPLSIAINQQDEYLLRIKHVMNIIKGLAKIMADVSWASTVVSTVTTLYDKYPEHHLFLNECVERGLTELIEPAKETLLRVYSCLNAEMVSQWERSYYRPSEHFTLSEDARISYETRLEKNLTMFRSVLLTTLVVSSPQDEDNSLVGLAVNYAQWERTVYANLHARKPQDVKTEVASIMQRTIRDYWYGNSQYTKFITDALLPLGFIPSIPTKYGDIDPLAFNHNAFFAGWSDEDLETYTTSTDDYILGSVNGEAFRAEHAEIELRRQEQLEEKRAMNRTPEEVLSEDRLDNGYVEEIKQFEPYFGVPVYGKIGQGRRNAELIHGLTTSTFEQTENGLYLYNNNRPVGALNVGKQEIGINPLNDNAVEWLRRSKLQPTKYAKLSGMEVFVVKTDVADEYYPRNLNEDITTSAEWRDIIERLMVSQVAGWRWNHHRPIKTIDRLEGNWELREGNRRLRSEDVVNLNATSLADHIERVNLGTIKNSFIENLNLFADYEPDADNDVPCHLHTRAWGGFSLIGKLNHTFETNTIMALGSALHKEGALKSVLIGGREFLAIRSDSQPAREFVSGQCKLKLPMLDLDYTSSPNHWWVIGCLHDGRFFNPSLTIVDLYLRTTVKIGDEEVEINTTTDLPNENVEQIVDGNICMDDIYAAFEVLEDTAGIAGLDEERNKVGAAQIHTIFTEEDGGGEMGENFNPQFVKEAVELADMTEDMDFTEMGNDTGYNFILEGIAVALCKSSGGNLDELSGYTKRVDYSDVLDTNLPYPANLRLTNWLEERFMSEVKTVATAYEIIDSLELDGESFLDTVTKLGDQIMELVQPNVMSEINRTLTKRLVRIIKTLDRDMLRLTEDMKNKLVEDGLPIAGDTIRPDVALALEPVLLIEYNEDFNRDSGTIRVSSELDKTIDRLLDDVDTDSMAVYLMDKETGNLYNAVDTKRHGRLYAAYA